MQSLVVSTLICLGIALCAESSAQCVGDCDNNGAVTIAEIVEAVGLALRGTSTGACLAVDSDDNDRVSIDELVLAVNSAVAGCADPTPTPTPTGFTISGCVDEFPTGGTCTHPGATVMLNPGGVLSERRPGDRRFYFVGIVPGEYTLMVVGPCTSQGCWEELAVSVVDRDVTVHIRAIPFPTPTVVVSQDLPSDPR